MAITTGIIDNAKLGFISGAFAAGDVYRLALIKAGATGTYNNVFAGNYLPTTVEEVANGSGYTTSGSTLTAYTAAIASNTASIDWADATWPASTISAIGAVLYKSGTTAGSNPIIAFYDFGGTISSTGGTFTAAIANIVKIG